MHGRPGSTPTAPRSEAARLIASHTPGDLDKVFFTNGGADANEHADPDGAAAHRAASRCSRPTARYHGGTHLAVNVTGDPRRWANDHGAAGTVHFFGPFLYRSAFHATTEAEECERALAAPGRHDRARGPADDRRDHARGHPRHRRHHDPAARLPLRRPRLCDEHGIVLIADEVMSGFGRAGRWFASELDGLVPDLLTFAKGVNSGYVPLGGVAISDAIAATFDDRVYPGGLTYSGPPAGLRRRRRHHPHDGGRPRRRARRRARRGGLPPRPGRARAQARVGRRGPRYRARSGPRARRRPRRRASRSRRTAAPARP